jgi:hypothetical protein
MDVITETCHAPLITVNSTVPATFRSITKDPPTLLVDEADALFGTRKQAENNEDLRALINAGHQRNRPCRRCVGPSQTPTDFETFAMVMLAAIGTLPDTVMDRSVVIRMRRRAPGERVAPFRSRRDAPPLNALRDDLAGWVRDNIDALRSAVPLMPLEDRAADTWEPLVAIADLAGADWPERVRKAATVLTQEAADDATETSLGLALLGDLRTVFREAVALYTTTLLERLQNLDEAPWSDLFGKPLDSRGLARRLRPYGVKSKDVREGGTGDPRKGYRREDLHPAWERYLSAAGDDATPATWATSQVNPPPMKVGVADASATSGPTATGTTSRVAHVAHVADTPTRSDLDRAVALVEQELGGVVDAAMPDRKKDRAKPLSGELFAVAADHDYPRTPLPDGTVILAGKDSWAAFCKLALPHEQRQTIDLLREIEAGAEM